VIRLFFFFFFSQHIVVLDEAKKWLSSVGYEQVLEREDWKLEAGNRYFFTRNHSTIVAFAIGKKYEFLSLFSLNST
jgi:aspartyl aminopeptidase